MSNSYHSYSSFLYLTLTSCLGSFFLGYQMAELSLLQTNLFYLFKWSDSERNIYIGFLTGLMPLGAMVGSFFAGKIAKNRGKRLSFIFADVIGVGGILFCLISEERVGFMLLGRFVCGIAVGINSSLIPSYISEMSPPSIRGALCSYFNTIIICGLFISTLIGFGVPSENSIKQNGPGSYWRVIFILGTIPCLLRLFLLIKVYDFDTIPFLLGRNEVNRAKEVLRLFYKEEHINDIFNEYHLEAKKNTNVSNDELFRGRLKKRMHMGLALIVIQTFSGANAVIYYSSTLFKSSSIQPGDYDFVSNLCSLLITFVLVVSSFFAGKIVDNYGRKIIILLGSWACSFFLFLIFFLTTFISPSFFINFLIKVLIFIFFFSAGVSVGPVMWVYEAEILPEEGIIWVSAMVWFCNAFLGIFFPLAINISFIGTNGTFLFFSVCMLFGGVYIYFNVKETKGKNNEEINRMFHEGTEGVEMKYVKLEA